MTNVRLDAIAQAELVRSGQASPAELAETAISTIEQLNPTLNAVITPLFDRARARASSGLPDGPFTGVPLVLKDYDGALGGAPYHCGMQALKDAGYVPEHSDLNVARLEAAGFNIVGKTNTPELGLVPTTESQAYGAARNPWNTDHSTGGSSGGSAAAVASGMVAVGSAGDGGGSIRIPASECGLVGLKPSRGRVPMGPDHYEGWAGLTVRGVITRTVRDTAAVYDAISGPDPRVPMQAAPLRRPLLDEVGADPGSLRIGVRTTAPGGLAVTDPEIVAVVDSAAKLAETFGHRIDQAGPDGLDDDGLVVNFFPAFGTWAAYDVAEKGRAIGRTLTADDVEPATWSLVEIGRATSAEQYLASLDWMHGWTRRILSWWESFDILLTPTLPELPPLLGQFAPQPDNALAGSMRAAALVPFMIPFNITGQPGISMPLGWSESGLPIGVQAVAAPGREDLLIALASQYEQAQPWADKAPKVSV